MLRRVFGLALAVIGLGLIAQPAVAQQAPLEIRGATTVNADGVIKLVEGESTLVILDNRRAEDYAQGHIENARRILDTDLTQAKMTEMVPVKTTPVLFYCNGLTCGRAAKAASMAIEWGYTRVYYYALGMDEWKKMGLPLVVAN
ncbi:MAG: rhodanese-like domain-containing protein [Alphaproteobacteria bacterium]|nr:rhodanese-like domain-containing protein [Alphaproteobacteria bacterium]TAD89299.1 MAG: rhodanese-like domain-containing protein [Alphaproteobacteria bacterium]